MFYLGQMTQTYGPTHPVQFVTFRVKKVNFSPKIMVIYVIQTVTYYFGGLLL